MMIDQIAVHVEIDWQLSKPIENCSVNLESLSGQLEQILLVFDYLPLHQLRPSRLFGWHLQVLREHRREVGLSCEQLARQRSDHRLSRAASRY